MGVNVIDDDDGDVDEKYACIYMIWAYTKIKNHNAHTHTHTHIITTAAAVRTVTNK